ncbi:MAG: pyridoxal phosphate-dependent aminotransferase [Desulfurococcales archaeon]|nr:pyridoxal phosphate-dependent aminotransferase [Desulfurococcales archaeon]
MTVNPDYNIRVDLFKESPTRKIDVIKEKLQQEGKDIILLSTGQPSIPPPKWAREKLSRELLEESMRLYAYTPTQGRKTVLEAIKQELEEHEVKLRDKQITLTAGGQSALYATITVLFNEGDNVVVFDPMYFGYWPLLDYAGVNVIDIVEDIKQGFKPDLDKLEEITSKKKIKAVIIVTPDNPTGRILTRDEAERLASLAEKHGFYIIVDEAYRTLVYEGEHHYLYKYAPERVIALNAFSKDPGIPGWRLGFAYGPEWIIQRVKLVVQETVYCTPAVAQRLVEIYLSDRERRRQHIEKVKQVYRGKRDTIIDEINKTLSKAEYTKPHGGMFLFLNLEKYLEPKSITAEQLSLKLLEEKGVATVPGSYFSKHYKHALRLSFVSETPERLREGIRRLAQLLEEI